MFQMIHVSVLYCMIVILVFVCGYLLFKIINVSSDVRVLEQFLAGDVFSDKFHQVIDNYFTHENNLSLLVHKILPLIYAHTTPILTTIDDASTVSTSTSLPILILGGDT
jgi:hypothetical protein